MSDEFKRASILKDVDVGYSASTDPRDATIAQQAAQIAELEADMAAWKLRCERRVADIQELDRRHAEQIARLEQQRGGVVLPSENAVMRVVLREMGNSTHVRGTSNWCADVGMAVVTEVKRLNPPGKFRIGDPVRKTKGSQWSGRIVGTYSTELTPEGYAVESFTERGSVQIYPAAALEACEETGECVAVPFNLEEFAKRAAVEMEKHDFHGFEPVVLAVAHELLAQQGKAVGDE